MPKICRYLLINQINDYVNHFISLRLFSIVLASKTKLFGKEPVIEMFMVFVIMLFIVTANNLGR